MEFIHNDLKLSETGSINHMHVALFVAHLTGKVPSLSYRTIRTYISALSFVFKLLDMGDPTSTELVRKALEGARKTGQTRSQLLPITKSLLHRMVDAIPHLVLGPYNQAMYKALFLLAYNACLRAGELVHTASDKHILQWNDVQKISNESCRGMQIKFRSYKHSGIDCPVLQLQETMSSHCPVKNLSTFLVLRGSKPGPLIATAFGRALSRNEMSKVLKSAIQFCGYDPQLYDTHSFRVGRVSQLAADNAPDSVIRATGRWKSNAYLQYIRPQAILLPP